MLPTENGQAFVSLDSRGFLDSAGHYLIYGSESLCGLAAGLRGTTGRDYRQILKQRGTPTIFRLRLAFDMISESDLTQFVQLVHDHIPVIRTGTAVPVVDFTFRLRSPLPAGCVLSHTHPKRIIDPLLGMIPYIVADERPIKRLQPTVAGAIMSRRG